MRDKFLVDPTMAKGIDMIEYEYSTVSVEFFADADTDAPWLRTSLLIEPRNEKLYLTYKDSPSKKTISLECYIEDWRDLFYEIIEERIYLDRRGSSLRGQSVSPKDLKISGKLNPLINLLVFAFCSHESAQLTLKFIELEPGDLEKFLLQNKNLHLKSAVKHARLVGELIERAFLRMKYLISDNPPRLSEIIKITRKTIAANEEKSIKLQRLINTTKNKIAYSSGRFLIIEIIDGNIFDNIYECAQYAVFDVEISYYSDPNKPVAVALGNKRADDYYFTLTYSHVEWEFSCDKLSEIPDSAFSAMEAYSDMIS